MSRQATAASQTRYIYSKLDINLAVFRYWQDKPREVLEMLYYDTALGNYLGEGFTREALNPGFEIVNNEGEVQFEDLDKIQMNRLIEIYIKARGAYKWFSHSVLIKFKFEGNQKPVLYWLEDTHINELETEPGTNRITKLKFRNPNDFPVSAGSDPLEVKGTALEDVRLLADPQNFMGKYRSKFEPITDNLLSFATLHQELTIGIIRTYSGLRFVIAPASYLADTESRAKIEKSLENIGHNFIFAAPHDAEMGKNFEFGIKFGEGSPPFSPQDAENVILTPISIQTKIPKEALKGNEIGLRSAETNRQAFLNALNEEQNACERDLLWLIEKEFEEVESTEGLSLEFKPLIEVDETEAVEIFDKKLDVLRKGIDMGADIESLLAKLDMGLDFDTSALMADKLAREALKQEMTEDQPEDDSESTTETDSQSTETEDNTISAET